MFVMKDGPRKSAISKMKIFVVVVKEWKLSKIVTNSSILDVITEVLDPV